MAYKANVLFFDKKPPRADGKPHTTDTWVYDLRTGQHFTLKQRPLFTYQVVVRGERVYIVQITLLRF